MSLQLDEMSSLVGFGPRSIVWRPMVYINCAVHRAKE